ncbi:MAG: UDP-N-acetylglucosamine 2-epimerase (non-hydrolyzing) [Candidatus Cloacimonadota bacterium]|nr:MAG: UDP-N-acetylglucosamine 2-epimerase (non-hydrolyzing) [Candidatus Cloacimonadota bacterium]
MKKNKLKVITVAGTRPEIIRLACVMPLLDKYVNHITVHTGQNYDYELNEVFYNDLELRKPDYYLGVDTSSLGHVLGETLIKIEEIFKKEQPDACLILGDTNASIAAIMAKRMKIPIYHMEAGNRSFDFNVPEEINRRIIDHTADFNLVYTENSRRHLLAEGLPHRRVYVTGSPMFEVLNFYKEKINSSNILDELNLKEKEYFIVSAHREENVDNKENLKKIVEILNNLAEKYDLPVIVSTHPRTRKRLEMAEGITIDERVKYLKPFGFMDYNCLQLKSKCAISDSGTISEESSILNFPAVTVRNSMERPEAIDAGTIIITGLIPEIVLNSVELVINEFEQRPEYQHICPEYQIHNTSWRVLKTIVGTAKLSNKWWGIN